jgi:hypothetical protein
MVDRLRADVPWHTRDRRWNELLDGQPAECDTVRTGAEDP